MRARITAKPSQAPFRSLLSTCTSMPITWSSARMRAPTLPRSCATIDWAAVLARYQNALQVAAPRPLEQKQFADLPSVTVEEVRAMVASGSPVQIIDTRPKHYTSRSHEIMAGAVWRDPERVDEWIGELSKEEPVITFCVYGFHIGCETAATLRKAGFDARFMAGGHYGWKAAKGAMRLFESASPSHGPMPAEQPVSPAPIIA